jgi:hypothetical protein
MESVGVGLNSSSAIMVLVPIPEYTAVVFGAGWNCTAAGSSKCGSPPQRQAVECCQEGELDRLIEGASAAGEVKLNDATALAVGTCNKKPARWWVNRRAGVSSS